MKFYHSIKNLPSTDAFLQRYDRPVQSVGKLPHWDLDGKLQFVTFRLADSLPQSKLAEYKFEKNEWLAQHPYPHSKAEIEEYTDLFGGKLDKLLDAGMGECLLKKEEVRKVLLDVIMYGEEQVYDVYALCIMPNHVHLLLHVYKEAVLNDEVSKLKRISAHRINKLLCREGRLWQRESFDRMVRSEKHLQRVFEYINHNGDKLSDSDYTVMVPV